jgi:hypothetical protein
LFYLCEEPVRADDVRRGVLADPHMHPPWKVLRRRTVPLCGQLELTKLLCLFAWPLRSSRLQRSVFIEGKMLRPRQMLGVRRVLMPNDMVW